MIFFKTNSIREIFIKQVKNKYSNFWMGRIIKSMVCGILKSLGRFGKYKFQLRPRNVMQNQHSNWVEGFYE